MKKTGIIRRFDDLGRIVIPKEIRRLVLGKTDTMGEPMEIFIDRENIVLKRYEKHTNANRIRNMSDEELAEFLADITHCEDCYLDDYCCFSDEMCKQNHLNWLQSKAD